jgi:hypothetical protein
VLATVPAWAAGTNLNGARNDGSAPATEAFRSAIQAAKAAGGGTVYVPALKYVTGPIELVRAAIVAGNFDCGLVLNRDARPTVRLSKTRHIGPAGALRPDIGSRGACRHSVRTPAHGLARDGVDPGTGLRFPRFCTATGYSECGLISCS